MCLVNYQNGGKTPGSPGYNVITQVEENLRFVLPRYRQSEVSRDVFQKLAWCQASIEHIRISYVVAFSKKLQHATQQQRLACPNLTRQHHETLMAAHRVVERRQSLVVSGSGQQKRRVRTYGERASLQIVKCLVHSAWVNSSSS